MPSRRRPDRKTARHPRLGTLERHLDAEQAHASEVSRQELARPAQLRLARNHVQSGQAGPGSTSWLQCLLRPQQERPVVESSLSSESTEHRDGRDRDDHLERQAILRFGSNRSDLAAGHRDPARGHRRQSGDGCGSELAAAHRHTRIPGVSRRTSQSERCGRHRAPPAFQRRAGVHIDDQRTAGPHLFQHRAGATTATTRGCWVACTSGAPSPPAMPRARQSRPTSIATPCRGSTHSATGRTRTTEEDGTRIRART
jgi:hypothetical protein